MKHSLAIVIVLFAASIVAGALAPPGLFAGSLRDIARMLQPLSSLGQGALLIIIFLNNSIKAFMTIVLGVVFGVPPLVFIVFNGFVIGALVAAMKSTASGALIAAALAPHGIIEVSLILLSAALGLRVGWQSLKWLTKRESRVKKELGRGLKLYARWVLGGLFIAAVIETFITPYFVRMAGG